MPEGDTIHRLAGRLRPRLVGGQVRTFWCETIDDAVAQSVVGRIVSSVEARGKNLLVHFDDGRALHVHLRMLGRLNIERPRSAFWAPRKKMPQLRIDVGGVVLVGERIPVVRVLRSVTGAVHRAPELRTLGPDLIGENIDVAECVLRLRRLGSLPIGEALLVQRALAGIGNVYKSETLFLEAVSPTAHTNVLPEVVLRALVERASALLNANLGPGPRTTRRALTTDPHSRHWVYGRAGLRCFRCQTTICRMSQGAPPGRSTYYCPACQTLPPP